MKKITALVATTLWLVLLTLAIAEFDGSKLLFLIFSLVYLVMLISAFYWKFSYGYLFIVIFLWLGFWLKLITHSITGSDYIEPIGFFNGEATAWNEVLIVASIAGVGVIIGRVLYRVMGRVTVSMESQIDVFKVPTWYKGIRSRIWVGMTFLALVVAIINTSIGIHQFGIAPRTVLIWPMNAVISWLLMGGLATGILTLFWWDVCSKKNILGPFSIVIVEAISTSVSVLSRSVFVFHIVPPLVALFKNRYSLVKVSKQKASLVALLAIVLFVVSLSAVTTLRGYSYRTNEDFTVANQVNIEKLAIVTAEIKQLKTLIQDIGPEHDKSMNVKVLKSRLLFWHDKKMVLEKKIAAVKTDLANASTSNAAFFRIIFSEFTAQMKAVPVTIQQLAVDRWLGLEGVMTVQSYPDKDFSFLLEGLKENPGQGEVGVYQTISNSIYLGMDPDVWKFGSIPGPVGFLYYSGSLWVVMLGMVAFTLCLHFFESLIYILTANPFLSSFYGFTLANFVAQFGIVPRQAVPHYFMLCCGILLIWFIQSRFFSKILRRMGLTRGD